MTGRYNFHGDPARFPVVADLISRRYGHDVKYIADVAGGQGLLCKLLRNRFGYEAEVVDPRGWRITGVPGREEEFDPQQASYYDLVVGVHPDQATRAIVLSALCTRTLLVPCCNFWDRSRRLGSIALVESIEEFYRRYGVSYQRLQLDFRGPKNLALLTTPPARRIDLASVTLPPSAAQEAPAPSRAHWLADRRSRQS